jgi:glycosyltransferase involved in cell wall biosynthesis
MKKVYILPAGENWICDRFVNEWMKYNSSITTTNYNDADIVWLLSNWVWRHIPINVLQEKQVITTIHHIVPDKFNKQEFMDRDQYTNIYVVPCQITHDAIKEYTNKPIVIIPYWIDLDIWPILKKKQCRKELNLDSGKYIIGSFQRDTENFDGKSPKLCKGPDIFCDYIDRIRKDIPNLHILLGGHRRQYVMNRLKDMEVEYTYLELQPQEVLAKMYNSLDLYVTSSRIEGGNQSLLECSTMKVPILSTDVGMARVVLHNNCIVDIKSTNYIPSEKDIEYNYTNVKRFDIQHITNYYEILFEKIRVK